MSLYLVSKAFLEVANDYSKADADAKIVLFGDAVYPNKKLFKDKKVYCIEDEVKKRGLDDFLPEEYERISYSTCMDMILAEKVIPFM